MFYALTDLALCSLLSASVAAGVCSVLWARLYHRAAALWERTLRNYQDEPGIYGTKSKAWRRWRLNSLTRLPPEESEAARRIRRCREHPEDYDVHIEESDGGLYVTLSLRSDERGTADAVNALDNWGEIPTEEVTPDA